MSNEEIRAIDCMAQHVRAFFGQYVKRKNANFAEPCEKCAFVQECSHDWTKIMEPILKYGTRTAIMAPLERLDKLVEKEAPK